ncbi:MAG: hypothetical protein J0I41_12835 [Filimonas sp.]|nr:hypothetical protein [Filimonas sp.]
MKKALLALALIATFASCKKEGSYERPKTDPQNNNGESNNGNDKETGGSSDPSSTGKTLVKWIQGVDFLTHKADNPDTIFQLKYANMGQTIQITHSDDKYVVGLLESNLYNMYSDGLYQSYDYEQNKCIKKMEGNSDSWEFSYDNDGLKNVTVHAYSANAVITVESKNGNVMKTSNGYVFTYTDKPNSFKNLLLINSYSNRFGLLDLFGDNEVFASQNLPASYQVVDGTTVQETCTITYTFNKSDMPVKAVTDRRLSTGDKQKCTYTFFYK